MKNRPQGCFFKGEWVEKSDWKAKEKRARGVSESEKPQKKKFKYYKKNA